MAFWIENNNTSKGGKKNEEKETQHPEFRKTVGVERNGIVMV